MEKACRDAQKNKVDTHVHNGLAGPPCAEGDGQQGQRVRKAAKEVLGHFDKYPPPAQPEQNLRHHADAEQGENKGNNVVIHWIILRV